MPRSVDAAVQSISRSLEQRAAQGDSDPITWRKLSSLIHACGWDRRSVPRLEELAAAVAGAGIFASLDLTAMDLGLDTTVRFGRRPWLQLGHVFESELALAYHLSKYPAALETALALGKLRHLSGGRKPEKQYNYFGSWIRPDLVFSSPGGPLVVVELERGDPKDESVDQLTRYMDAVSTRHNRPSVGALISGRPRRAAMRRHIHAELEQLEQRGSEVVWLWYDVGVELNPVVR